jgi:MFS family permease
LAQEEKRKFFYGWVVVGGAWLTLFVRGGSGLTISVFFPSLMEEFGWSRGMLSLGFTIRMGIMGIMGVISGVLVGRIGPRRTVIIGALIGGLGIGLLSQVSQVWQFIIFYGVIASIGGGLAGGLATLTTVRRWFMRKAGFTLGLTMSGNGLGVVAFAPLGVVLLHHYEWRTSYIIFGIIMAVGATIGGMLLKRDPESHGYYPDGIKPSQKEIGTRTDFAVRSYHWSIKDVAKNRNFWFYVLAMMGYFLALNGLTSNLVLWGTDLGMSDIAAAGLLSIFIMSSVIARVSLGLFSDWSMNRYKGSTRKPVLSLCLILTGLGCLLGATVVTTQAELIVIAIMIGFGNGVGMSLFPALLGDLFGVLNIPLIQGVGMFFTTAFAAIGPIMFGYSHDITNSYNLALTITAILCAVSLLSLVAIQTPQKRR